MGPFNSVKYDVQIRQIGSWYAEEATFLCYKFPLIMRGGNRNGGSEAGVFDFGGDAGSAFNSISFRVVLSF